MAEFRWVPGRPLATPDRLRHGPQAARMRSSPVRCHPKPAGNAQARARAGPGQTARRQGQRQTATGHP